MGKHGVENGHSLEEGDCSVETEEHSPEEWGCLVETEEHSQTVVNA